VKTDKRDAIRPARLLAAGELTLVTIPSVEREQLRDLVRCREDIRVDLMRARHSRYAWQPSARNESV
jgi:transposase